MKTEIKKFENWKNLPAVQKAVLIKEQVYSCLTTADTVALDVRKQASTEQETLFVMMNETFMFYGVDNPEMVETVTRMFIEEYGAVAIQDFALFLRKVSTGKYGEVYGKFSGGWIMSKFRNFFDSVNYNYTVQKDKQHMERKIESGSRDTGNYYDDIRPEIIE